MNMKKTLMAAVVLLGGLAMAADNSYSFTYQAALRDEHGLVISNGTAVARNQTVTLRLWDAPTGGDLLWGRTYNVYTDETGLFNLEVSDDTGSKADDAPADASLERVFAKHPAGAVYIGLFVKGSSGEIVPRQRLFAVPFAAVANDVRKISSDVTVGGNITMMNGANKGLVISPSGISQQSGSSTFQNVVANGTIGASGVITAGGGLVVNGGTVNFKPDVTLDRNLTVKGATALNGGVTVSGGDLAVAADKKVTVGGSEVVPVPVGGVIMWTKSIPPEGGSWSGYKSAHWAICNGQNGTPDLRGRFVVSANNSTTGKNTTFTQYDYAAVGGEERHSLTKGEMPNHYHYHPNDVRASGFVGGYNAGGGDARYIQGGDGYKSGGDDDARIMRTGTAGGDSSMTNKGTDGYASAHENRPPYYALYYIMRIK